MTENERKMIDNRLYGTFEKYNGMEPQQIKKDLDDKFCKEFTVNPIENHEYLIELLKQAIEEKDKYDIESIVALIAHFGYYAEILDLIGPLLTEPWHHMHDSIAMGLEFEANPKTINYLYQGAQYRCENLEYESDYCEFNRKCIWGLWKIGTEDAIEKIRSLSSFPNEVIKNHALAMLKKIDKNE